MCGRRCGSSVANKARRSSGYTARSRTFKAASPLRVEETQSWELRQMEIPQLCRVETGPLFCGLAAAEWREAQPQPQGDQGGGRRAYHPSTALRRTCPRTGAEAWRCCHSGDPCFSSATRRLCNPPARARISNHRLHWGHKCSQPLRGQADPTGGEVKKHKHPKTQVSIPKKEMTSDGQWSGKMMSSVV